VKQSKIRVSVLVKNTQGVIAVFLLAIVGSIGGVYLFILNHVAFRGYVLQKQVEEFKSLETQLSTLETTIAKIEAQEFLQKNRMIKSFDTYDTPQFFVQKDVFTAKETLRENFHSEL
jgi:hypothetical protein